MLVITTVAVWVPSLDLLFVETITVSWFQAAFCMTAVSLKVQVNTSVGINSQGGDCVYTTLLKSIISAG